MFELHALKQRMVNCMVSVVAGRAMAVITGIIFLVGFSGPSIAQQKSVTASQSEPRYEYDTAGMRMEGTLVERRVYGPPDYGETPAKDAKERILILKLAHAISVEPTADAQANGSVNLDPARHIQELQLFISRAKCRMSGSS
ncbi:MAG TPA: hypothetical protein VFB79_21660 [Candidatus Angelobacter sp.]|nr:hypothetical protein [Candidatus Angelobacter sp.]